MTTPITTFKFAHLHERCSATVTEDPIYLMFELIEASILENQASVATLSNLLPKLMSCKMDTKDAEIVA